MKYRFKIYYEPKEWKEVTKFLQKCDVIAGFFCLTHIMEFTSENDLDIHELKNLIMKGYTELGNQVHSIEGWKNNEH